MIHNIDPNIDLGEFEPIGYDLTKPQALEIEQGEEKRLFFLQIDEIEFKPDEGPQRVALFGDNQSGQTFYSSSAMLVMTFSEKEEEYQGKPWSITYQGKAQNRKGQPLNKYLIRALKLPS